jgi:hypothetical protein
MAAAAFGARVAGESGFGGALGQFRGELRFEAGAAVAQQSGVGGRDGWDGNSGADAPRRGRRAS